MTNTEEQRLAQRVLEQLRRDPGNQMSSGDLYAALGGQKVLRYTENEFRAFLGQHCAFAEERESGGDENTSPKYTLQDTLRRKRTNNISKGQPTNTHTPAGNSFDVKTHGYKTLLYAAKKLADYSGDGLFAWNELRKSYKKDTGRHLTVEELNLMIGASNMTKCQILSTMFNGIFEPSDSKALIIRMNTKKPFSELLKMRNAAVLPNSSSSSCDHQKCESLRASSGDTSSVSSSSATKGSDSSEIRHNSSLKSTSDIQTVKEVANVHKIDSPMKEAEVGDDEVFSTEDVNILNSQAHFENDEETVHKFAESLIQHRNSLPDEFGDEIYGVKTSGDYVQKTEDAEPDLSAVKSELELTGLTSNEQSTISNGMNAAFLADDSIRTSFCTPMDGSFETSGERGYLTCSEQLSDAAADVSLNISSTESVDPPTPRRTHEITLCSSRNGIATVLPQPDISPLCSANHLLDSPSVFGEADHSNSVTPESTVEEPIPLPRTIASVSSDSSNDSVEVGQCKSQSFGVVPSGDSQQDSQSESFVEDPAPTNLSVITKTEEVITVGFEPVISNSKDVQNLSINETEVSDPVIVQPTTVTEPVNEAVSHEPIIVNPVEVPEITVTETAVPEPNFNITEEATVPVVNETETVSESTVTETESVSEPTVTETESVSEPTVTETESVSEPVITTIEEAPETPVTKAEETPEVIVVETVDAPEPSAFEEVHAEPSDSADVPQDMFSSEPSSVHYVGVPSYVQSDPIITAASPAKPARSIPSITIQLEEETEKLLLQSQETNSVSEVKKNCGTAEEKQLDGSKPEQDVHGETFVEEVSILMEQNLKDSNEAGCTFIKDEPAQRSPARADNVFENPEALQDSDEEMSLLTQKSESTITVIQLPLTSKGQEQEGSDSDSIPYDNDESSNSSSPAKTVTVEVELNSSNIAQVPSSGAVFTEEAPKTAEIALKKEIPECIPEDEMKSPVDDEPSRDPSIVSEQEAQSEEQETNPEIQCLSPEAEMPEEGILVQKPELNEKESRRKNKKRARMVAPRRRLFNCCTVL